MRIFILLFFTLHLYGNISGFKYYKDINITTSKSKLIKLKIDKELYSHSQKNFRDIRLYEGEKEQGFFIKDEAKHFAKNRITLYPNSYDRQKATISFVLNKPFDVKEIILNISDRNFETTFDIYINEQLASSSVKIYDYSKETGNQNFTIKIDAKKVKKITLSYNLSKTHFFYKKYKEIEKSIQYLTLKSLTLKNDNKVKITYDYFYTNLQSMFTKEKVSTYIFDTNNLTINTLKILSKTKHFQRECKIYKSENGEEWDKVGKYTIYKGAFDSKKSKLHPNIRAKYIRLDIKNQDNQPIDITALKIENVPLYLYFFYEWNKKYRLYFGNENTQLPNYDLKHLISKSNETSIASLSKLQTNNIYKNILKSKPNILEEYKEILFTIFIFFSIALLTFIATKILKTTKDQ